MEPTRVGVGREEGVLQRPVHCSGVRNMNAGLFGKVRLDSGSYSLSHQELGVLKSVVISLCKGSEWSMHCHSAVIPTASHGFQRNLAHSSSFNSTVNAWPRGSKDCETEREGLRKTLGAWRKKLRTLPG